MSSAEKDSKLVVDVAKRFREAVDKGEDAQKMRGILSLCTREEMMRHLDENGMDLLHYCILRRNTEAVDFLLKQGYFARPHQPAVSLYLHLAAFLGLKTMVTVLVQHRPDDFATAPQPLLVPPEYLQPRGGVRGGGGLGASTESLSVSSRHSRLQRDRPLSPLRQGSHSSLAATPRGGAPAPDTRRTYSARTKGGPAKDGLDVKTRAELTEPSSASETPETATTKTRVPQPDSSSDSRGGVGGSSCSWSRLDSLKLDGSTPLLRTPLYVAAVARKLDCVRALLDTCVLKAHPETPSKGYFTLVALADCPTSLALLIKHMDPEEKGLAEDFKAAVTYCVQSARPDCLDLLLKHAPKAIDIRNLFKGINFYHVLYTFSASYGKGVYARLGATTAVLINHGHDASAKVPPRTYPLYTLLTHSISYQDRDVMQFYIECMKMLLQAGASPNFDEVEFEKELLKKKGIKFAAGRNAYSSALHCLLETVELYASLLESKYLAVHFIEECAEALISHKADMAKVGRIGDARSTLQGNILHQYAKSSVNIGVDRAVIQCILRYGGDPDVKINGKYAVNVYFDKLFEMLSSLQIVDAKHRYQEDINLVLTHFCRFMSSGCLCDASHIFQFTHGRNRSEQVKYYLENVVRDLQMQSREVRSLQRQAAWRVWIVCGKRPEVVRNLRVKVELKTVILPLLPEAPRKIYFPR